MRRIFDLLGAASIGAVAALVSRWAVSHYPREQRHREDEQAILGVLADGKAHPSMTLGRESGLDLNRMWTALDRLEQSGRIKGRWEDGSFSRRHYYLPELHSLTGELPAWMDLTVEHAWQPLPGLVTIAAFTLVEATFGSPTNRRGWSRTPKLDRLALAWRLLPDHDQIDFLAHDGQIITGSDDWAHHGSTERTTTNNLGDTAYKIGWSKKP